MHTDTKNICVNLCVSVVNFAFLSRFCERFFLNLPYILNANLKGCGGHRVDFSVYSVSSVVKNFRVKI